MSGDDPVSGPEMAPDVFLCPGVEIIGQVRLASRANVWFGSILRGDINRVEVGQATNIQDQCILHVTHEAACRVGSWVTVGHRAVLHGCDIEHGCLIGMGAIILTGAKVEAQSIIGAGSVVREGEVIPPASLAVGVPAKVVRPLSKEEMRLGEKHARGYLDLVRQYQSGKYPKWSGARRNK